MKSIAILPFLATALSVAPVLAQAAKETATAKQQESVFCGSVWYFGARCQAIADDYDSTVRYLIGLNGKGSHEIKEINGVPIAKVSWIDWRGQTDEQICVRGQRACEAALQSHLARDPESQEFIKKAKALVAEGNQAKIEDAEKSHSRLGVAIDRERAAHRKQLFVGMTPTHFMPTGRASDILLFQERCWDIQNLDKRVTWKKARERGPSDSVACWGTIPDSPNEIAFCWVNPQQRTVGLCKPYSTRRFQAWGGPG